jgi:hypothetical protein
MGLTLTFPPVPQGFSGNLNEFLEWLQENASIASDGDGLDGQIGGSRPTSDIGVFFRPDGIETFREGSYKTISDVPIGVGVPFFGQGDVPVNHVEMLGQSLLRADYPLLFAVIGTTWGSESATTFTLPDARGRVIRGAGTGSYDEQNVDAEIEEVDVGEYGGFSYPRNKTPYAGAPTGAQGAKRIANAYLLPAVSGNTAGITDIINPFIGARWIMRYR